MYPLHTFDKRFCFGTDLINMSLTLNPSDFALSYAKNGELLRYIRKIGSFDETCTRFYTAELVCALEFLHSIGIIHRYVLRI